MLINKARITGLLGISAKAGKITFGADACQEGVAKRNIYILFVANDASDRTKKNFEKLCVENKIGIVKELSMHEISKAIGKNNKAIVGIKDKNLANAVLKIINGGDIIG